MKTIDPKLSCPKWRKAMRQAALDLADAAPRETDDRKKKDYVILGGTGYRAVNAAEPLRQIATNAARPPRYATAPKGKDFPNVDRDDDAFRAYGRLDLALYRLLSQVAQLRDACLFDDLDALPANERRKVASEEAKMLRRAENAAAKIIRDRPVFDPEARTLSVWIRPYSNFSDRRLEVCDQNVTEERLREIELAEGRPVAVKGETAEQDACRYSLPALRNRLIEAGVLKAGAPPVGMGAGTYAVGDDPKAEADRAAAAKLAAELGMGAGEPPRITADDIASLRLPGAPEPEITQTFPAATALRPWNITDYTAAAGLLPARCAAIAAPVIAALHALRHPSIADDEAGIPKRGGGVIREAVDGKFHPIALACAFLKLRGAGCSTYILDRLECADCDPSLPDPREAEPKQEAGAKPNKSRPAVTEEAAATPKPKAKVIPFPAQPPREESPADAVRRKMREFAAAL